MADVQFEENENMTFKSRKILGEAQIPKIVQFLIEKRVTRDARQAYYLLLGITIISLLVTIFIFCYFILGIGVPSVTSYKIPIELKMQMEASKNTNVTP